MVKRDGDVREKLEKTKERIRQIEKNRETDRIARNKNAIIETTLVNDSTDDINERVIPYISSTLRHHIVKVPEIIRRCSGIVIYGRRIKSLLFTTDLAIIRNCDADAILAVYPFTPQQVVSEYIIKAASVPVFVGVGGGTTRGVRTLSLAKDAEFQGATAVVLNSPITNRNLRAVATTVDIPVVITVTHADTDIASRLRSGAAILNVAAGPTTPDIVAKIKAQYPEVAIIASGGPTEDSISKTIAAGANAITYTPPSAQELFSEIMDKYRSTNHKI